MIIANRSLKLLALLICGFVIGFVAWELLPRGKDNEVGRIRILPDGSKLRLERVIFTSQGFSYSFVPGGKPVHWILTKLPVGLRKKLPLPGGAVAYGGPPPGNTTLLVLTIHPRPHAPGSFKSYSLVVPF